MNFDVKDLPMETTVQVIANISIGANGDIKGIEVTGEPG